MGTMRTAGMMAKYIAHRMARVAASDCELCAKEPIKVFKHWKIVECMFPWDKVAKLQHMILPYRHVTDLELTIEEWQELYEIKQNHLQADYEVIAEATNKKKSIPAHWHLHLIVVKD